MLGMGGGGRKRGTSKIEMDRWQIPA